ncbi:MULTISPECIES: hypothetical protein [unclassified Sphingomonas]|nr:MULTISPECIES: hypothetical protein [unclassified Sphingomonas]
MAAKELLERPEALRQELLDAAIADLLADASPVQRSEMVGDLWQSLAI